MSTVHDSLESVIATLGELHSVLERLRGEFVHGINTPDDYERACNLLDELTSGGELSLVEEKILIELEDAILLYQRDSEQFRESNAAFDASCTPAQLLRDLMENLGLTNSDLPEIGDKSAVSRVLHGKPMSHKVAYALAERFAMDPKTFLDPVAGNMQELDHLVPVRFTAIGAGGPGYLLSRVAMSLLNDEVLSRTLIVSDQISVGWERIDVGIPVERIRTADAEAVFRRVREDMAKLKISKPRESGPVKG